MSSISEVSSEVSEWVKTSVNISLAQSKELIFFNVTFNGTTWGPGLPIPERIDGSSLKSCLEPGTLELLKDKLKEISKNFEEAFGEISSFKRFREIQKLAANTPLEAYINLYGKPENMEGYMDGKPRNPEKIVRTYMRDIVRWGPVDGASETSYSAATPWTGMVGYVLPREESGTSTILGRAANGTGRSEGFSEAGLFLSKDQRGRGLGKDGIVALLVHAWLFSKLGMPVNGHPVKSFTATVYPENEKAQKLIETINKSFGDQVIQNEAPSSSFKPYGQGAPRDLQCIKMSDIEKVLGLFVSQNQILINGIPASDFIASKTTTP